MVSKSACKPPRPSCSSSPADKQRFKGVRMRSWGKWVSEIRLPNTRARLWLGSFTTAEQAARAFDVAVVCLRGRSVALNFPNSPPTYAPLGLPHHQIQELAAAAAADSAPSAPPSSCELTDRPTSSCELTVRPNSDESDTSTISCSSHSDESEAATTNEMSSSSCSSASSDDSATFAGLLELDEESEQSSPLDAALQGHALNMGSEWDELLWGFPMTGYSAAWEEPLLLLAPFPVEDDDLATIVEPSLWSL